MVGVLGQSSRYLIIPEGLFNAVVVLEHGGQPAVCDGVVRLSFHCPIQEAQCLFHAIRVLPTRTEPRHT